MNLIARFDLDKTYLRSEFDTLTDLAKSAFERGDQKRAVPGATELLQEIIRGGGYLHVLSGSPEQLRASIRLRLKLDNVSVDKLTLKPNLRNLLRLRFRSLRDQLGYKLHALLSASEDEAKSGVAAELELLVGDDSEADAFVYSLYADIREGSLDQDQLSSILSAGQLYRDDAETILWLAKRRFGSARPNSTIVLIHLANQTAPSEFDAFGPRVGAFFNYAQAAFILFEHGLLSRSAVLRVTAAFTRLHRFDSSALARSYWDLGRRGLVSERSLRLFQTDAKDQEPWIQEALALGQTLNFSRDTRRFDANYKFLAGRGRTRQNRA